MSTEPTRRGERRRAGLRRFALTLAGVLGALAVLAGAGGAASLAQGPRVSEVQVDPASAIEVSGSRVILTVNQALAEIDPAQVSVSPAAPFTVDAAGRSVGVRFTVPLDDDTDYTVRIDGARAVGGGPERTLETTFRTPPAEVMLLQRDPEGDDTIFRSTLDGENAVPVYSAPVIEDFRATSTRLVVATAEDGVSALHVMNRDGSGVASIELPGEGIVQGLQVSHRGDLVGYTYSDPSGAPNASVLFTSQLRDPSAMPTPIEVGGEAVSVDQWRFVPDSSALLLVDFDGELILTDPQSDADPTLLGGAVTIDAIARGSYTAIVERVGSGIGQLDLTTGEESALVEPDRDLGQLGRVTPVPEGAEGRAGTIRQFQRMDEAGHPAAQVLAHVAEDGTTRPLFEAESQDALLQACVSPSGRYVAALVAPDIVNNPYDVGGLPMPRTLQTHIIEVDSGEQVSALAGFDISWCTTGPW
ncbi:Ig-like domain-containing protein [Microbacterium paludicola]|uniref:Ig-like domain-containing protein n=1 Tax=Microbacterium paludicola TaxID=300019 RepID=UPI00387A0230